MNVTQALGVAVMVIGLVTFAFSLSRTLQSQSAGARVPTAHARLRISTFAIVFFGAGIFLLGTATSVVFALTMFLLAALVFWFAMTMRFA